MCYMPYLWPWYHDLWLWVSFSYIHTWAGVPYSDMMILVGTLQIRIFCMLHKEQVQCYVTSPEPMKPFDKTEKNRRRYVLPLLLKDLSWNKMSLFSVWLTFFLKTVSAWKEFLQQTVSFKKCLRWIIIFLLGKCLRCVLMFQISRAGKLVKLVVLIFELCFCFVW